MPKRTYLGEFELMVMLVLIRLGDNAYGVPISRELETTTGRVVTLGSVNAALNRLEKKIRFLDAGGSDKDNREA